MQRCFIVSKESEYSKKLEKHIERAEQQRKFIVKFFEEKGIEANEYLVSGNGFVNCPFKESGKRDIRLNIIPIDNDLINFQKMLTKPDKYGLRCFKKNSSISKDFAQRCVDEKVIINLHEPQIRDYFKSIRLYAYSYQKFEHNNNLYLKVTCNFLKEDDTPEGFKEIKLSEYYIAKENTSS